MKSSECLRFVLQFVAWPGYTDPGAAASLVYCARASSVNIYNSTHYAAFPSAHSSFTLLLDNSVNVALAPNIIHL